MKKFFYFSILWFAVVFNVFAEMPTAKIDVNLLNNQFPAQYILHFSVPENHHAYLDKGEENVYIPIALDNDNGLNTFGLKLDKLEKPAGTYDSEVKATVLRGLGNFRFVLNQTEIKPLNSYITLSVKYQLCNDVTHVCFRPQAVKINLANPLSTEKIEVKESASFTDNLLSLFKSYHNNILIMFGLMFVAGILSVATPCVYPMLPITSMFIVNRANGNARKEKQHALVYLLGIVGTYTLLGLVAGMTGGAFNSFMQSAWVNLAFAGFFAFFAIALLGFYELAFMQNEVHELDQHSARVGGLLGTWLMGTVAGLVISPCVGPIVFALLLQIADNIADKSAALALLHQEIHFGDKFKIAAQGSFMMAGFGLGVGLPFFIISIVKIKLPRAGYWMNKIKYGFGLAILYFAYIYLHKGFGVLGIDDTVTLAFSISLICLWLAVVYFHVLSLLPVDAPPNQKMHHFLGVIALLLGGWLLINSLGQMPLFKASVSTTVLSNATTAEKSNSAIEIEAGISWYRNFEAAQKAALESNKPIFIDFFASWCANCIAFKEETTKNSALNEALRTKAITLKLVDKEPEFEKFRENPAHRQLKIGLPYFAIIKPSGEVIWSSTDYQATEQMIAELNNFSN